MFIFQQQYEKVFQYYISLYQFNTASKYIVFEAHLY